LVEFESHYDRYRNFIQEGTWKEEAEQLPGSTRWGTEPESDWGILHTEKIACKAIRKKEQSLPDYLMLLLSIISVLFRKNISVSDMLYYSVNYKPRKYTI